MTRNAGARRIFGYDAAEMIGGPRARHLWNMTGKLRIVAAQVEEMAGIRNKTVMKSPGRDPVTPIEHLYD